MMITTFRYATSPLTAVARLRSPLLRKSFWMSVSLRVYVLVAAIIARLRSTGVLVLSRARVMISWRYSVLSSSSWLGVAAREPAIPRNTSRPAMSTVCFPLICRICPVEPVSKKFGAILAGLCGSCKPWL